MDPSQIGCSLAEAAESPQYSQYLAEAAKMDAPALHVVYINTSLRTKAQAHAQVPTITCTSSNVVQTILQVRQADCKGGSFCKWRPPVPAWPCRGTVLDSMATKCLSIVQHGQPS